jgi:hypothetical protein
MMANSSQSGIVLLRFFGVALLEFVWLSNAMCVS